MAKKKPRKKPAAAPPAAEPAADVQNAAADPAPPPTEARPWIEQDESLDVPVEASSDVAADDQPKTTDCLPDVPPACMICLPRCTQIDCGPRDLVAPMIHSYRMSAKAYRALASLMEARYPGVDHHVGHMQECLTQILEAYADAQ